MLFKSNNLLVISPNTHDIVNDQLQLISQHFNKTSVIVPISTFSQTALQLPYFKKNFEFMRINLRTEDHRKYYVYFSKFLTLPINSLRKRNHFFIAKSCEKTILKRKIPFDIMHAHFLYSAFSCAYLKERYNKPFVVTAHGGDAYDLPFRNKWNNDLARYILNNADKVITVSQLNIEKMRSLGVPSSKLRLIPNGYNEKLFRPISSVVARNRLGLPINRPIILTVGNLVEIKGHSYLIDAMSSIQKNYGDALLIIVGSGKLFGTLQNRVEQTKLTNKVIFVGNKNHNEIPLWMNACDVFVLPSLGEGFPAVIPEALACGKPVVSTSVGGVPEVISNHDVGLLVPSPDPQRLAAAISTALDRDWSVDTILNHIKPYAWSNIAKEVLNVYSEILS